MLIATLNDYWTTWKLDVIFADHPNKKEGQQETVNTEEVIIEENSESTFLFLNYFIYLTF